MKIIVFFILLAHGSVSLASAWNESLTYDEIFYREEGIAILTSGQYLDPYIPPLSKIMTGVPVVLGAESLIPSPFPARKLIISRALTIIVSLGLVWLIYKTARDWYGQRAGLVALVLAAFEPTILGHNHYLTSDIPLTFFVFSTYVAFVKKRAVLTGFLMGLALATKLTAIIILTPLIVFAPRKKAFFMILAIVITVWAIYGFRSDVIIAERDDPTRVSSRLSAFAAEHNIPFLPSVLLFFQKEPLPLGGYLAIVKNSIIRAVSGGVALPQLHTMPVTILLKTPIPLLAFLLVSIRYRKHNLLILIPIMITLLITSFAGFSSQVRYSLPMYPFLILIASSSVLLVKTKTAKILCALLLGWYVFSTIREFPHFISYANEFAGGANRRYVHMTDSNIDWGQGLFDLSVYVQREKPARFQFSYFGRDDAALYGFRSIMPYGSHRFEGICAFHPVVFDAARSNTITAISISNWYGCGYYSLPQFSRTKIKEVVGGSILIF